MHEGATGAGRGAATRARRRVPFPPVDLRMPLAPEVVSVAGRRQESRGGNKVPGEPHYPRPLAGFGVRMGASARYFISSVSSTREPCAVTR